jgi:hypothetical protein
MVVTNLITRALRAAAIGSIIAAQAVIADTLPS